jgi:hypothetical protein
MLHGRILKFTVCWHLQKQQDPSLEDSSESDSEDDEDDSEESGSDADDPTGELIKSSREEAAERAKADRKAKKRAAKEQLEGIAKKRRKKDVNLNGDYALNGLSSLSGRQDRKIPIPPACYNCGGPHMKRDCPKLKRGYQGEDDGPPRKALRAKWGAALWCLATIPLETALHFELLSHEARQKTELYSRPRDGQRNAQRAA